MKKAQVTDALDTRRRLEQIEPELAQELARIVLLVPAEAGVELIDLAQRRLRARAPELAWEPTSAVRKWLREAASAA